MFLLEQDNTRKEQVDKNTTRLEFDQGNKKKYNIEEIHDSVIYVKELEDHLPKLYYLILWKKFYKEQNTGEPA